MYRKAHDIKPGDKINGITVFDTIRKGFNGFYIPLEDGTRIAVASPEAAVYVA